MKHTKGEWTKNFDGHGGINIESNGKQIGYISGNENQEANAKLIAAAPELLKSLVNILNWHKAHNAISFMEVDAIASAEAVIKKATA